MFGLIFPLVIAAAVPLPTPQPTLPPEIGIVFSRSHCSESQKTIMRVLPVLMRNDNTIGTALTGMGKLDSSEDASTRLTITRTRTMSSQIFKNLDVAKDDVMKLHVLAAASTNSDQAKQFSDLADNLDTIVAQQNAVADTLNGYADTADMGLLRQGSEGERQMAAATGPSDNSHMTQQQIAHPQTLGYVNVGQLTTNVYRDIQNMRAQLAQTEAQTSVEVKGFIKTCAAPKHKP